MQIINSTDSTFTPEFMHNAIGTANLFGADKVEINDQLVWLHFGKPTQLGYRTAVMTVNDCFNAKSPAELVGKMFREQLDRVHKLTHK